MNKWKEIQGFEGLYKISNEGKIYSNKINAIMKTYINNNGYECVQLTKNKKRKHFLVHRLVAKAFIPNIDNKPQVNHIDGNKANNRVENLEWYTNSENQIHAYKNGLNRSKKKQCTINGIDYESITEAANQLGVSRATIQSWLKCS